MATTSISSDNAAANPLFNRTIFLLSMMGIVVAGLLWNWHAHPVDIPCGGTQGCVEVAQSKYAAFPIGSDYPVAMYGFSAIWASSFWHLCGHSRMFRRQISSC